jgi:hypothetical protein
MDRLFLGFPPLPKALERILELDDTQLEKLQAEVSGPEGFGIDDSRALRLAQLLPLDDEVEAVDLLESLEFLYDRCREWEGRERADFRQQLRAFLRATRLWKSLGAAPDSALERLAKLLQPNASIEQKRKLRWLRTGILENAVEFSTFVDLRPDFARDRSEVRGLIPVIILRIRTESELERDRSCVFQLTVDGLKKLRSALEDVDHTF